MTTQAFPAGDASQDVGTPLSSPTGTMSVKMKRVAYYNGARLAVGTTYPVTIAWGKWAVEEGYATDLSGVLPNIPTPAGLTAAQTASTQALVSSAWKNRSGAMALFGDSIASAGVSTTGLDISTRARGPAIWTSCYLGWPWPFDETSHNFAVGGTDTAVMRSSQLPAFLAAAAGTRFAKVFVSAGTNDTNAGRSFADITDDLTAIFDAMRGTGAMPVMWGILPRGADVAMTDAKRTNMRINEWLRKMASDGYLDFIDAAELLADNSAAFGNALTATMMDSGTFNLHPNSLGAGRIGKLMADYYTARGEVGSPKYATQQGDIFNRDFNPGGVAFNTTSNPLMQGGTTAPTGMTTSGGTWSKSNRTLANGQTRSDPVIADMSLSASTTHYLYDDWVNSGAAWASDELQPGDVVEGRCWLEITDGVNIRNVNLLVTEHDGNSTASRRCLYESAAGELIPDGSHDLHFVTPRLTIRDYYGSGTTSIFQKMEILTAAASSGSARIKAFELRKV